MPFSYAQYAGNGSATTFSVPFPYLLKAHVKLFYGFNLVNGTFTSELVDGVGFAWTSGTQVQTTVAPAVGQTLTVVRQTPSNALVVQWQDGSNLIAGDLIDSSLQTLYAVQEQEDAVLLASAQSAAAAAASTAAVTTANAASATANGIAGTANTALSNSSAAVTTANAASATATAAQTTANGIAGTANTALSNSSAAVTTANAAQATANGIAGTANTALSNSSAAVTTANAADATANGIAGTANTALSNSSAAVTTANTAQATANTALSNAATAQSTANSATSAAAAAQSTANSATTAAAAAQSTANAALPKAGGTMTGNLVVPSVNGGPLAGLRNRIINGNFDIWQRGTSFTGSEYGADRWQSGRTGTTHTATRQAFTPGQTDVPNNPAYYIRTVVSSVAGAGNIAYLAQLIEGVRTLSGQQVTVSFWAKADSTKNISAELAQFFGTGGSPSAVVNAIGVTKVSIGTAWQKVTVTANVPSISGKTLGTDGNDYLGLFIWFDAGSTFNSRTDTLGQQSGTFEIAQVQVEPGPTATPFEQRPPAQELQLCYRYFRLLTYYGGAFTGASVCYIVPEGFNDFRATPAITSSVNGFQFYNGSAWTTVSTSTGASFQIYVPGGAGKAIQVNGLAGNASLGATTTSAAIIGSLSAEL